MCACETGPPAGPPSAPSASVLSVPQLGGRDTAPATVAIGPGEGCRPEPVQSPCAPLGLCHVASFLSTWSHHGMAAEGDGLVASRAAGIGVPMTFGQRRVTLPIEIPAGVSSAWPADNQRRRPLRL